MNETKVQIVGTVGAGDFERLQSFAERHGIVHKANGRPNLSRALREVVTAGLRALDAGASNGQEVQIER